MDNLKVIGQSVHRVDAREKVSGTMMYATDLTATGMLWARTLRSPHAHARLLSIDTSRARELPGVECVITAEDIEGTNKWPGIVHADQPALVEVGDTVKRVGDPVAAVAARTKAIAEEALDLIEVEYEPLPGVFSPQEALADGAPQIHKDVPNNITGEQLFERGDIEQGFAEADVIVEGSVILPRQEHAYLEVEGGMATIDNYGIVTITAPTQRLWHTRKSICDVLGLPEAKVRVISPTTGGGFGGKTEPSIHAILVLLTLKTHKPVKMVWSREESFLVHPKRHPFWVKGKLGAKKDGTFTALEVELLSDGGAYSSHSIVVLHAACAYMPGPYNIPHFKSSGRAVFTNNPISGAFRGYGQPQAITILESLVGWMAKELGADPAEIRLKNALKFGDTPGTPRIILDAPPSLPITVEKALEAAGELAAPSGPNKKTGRGFVCSMPVFDTSNKDVADMRGVGAKVEVFRDGTAVVRSGVCDIGSGITTVLGQIAAEQLGLTMNEITVINGNTESTPDSGPIVASRQTYCSGNAVLLAAKDIKGRLLEVASDILNAEESELEMVGGMIRARGTDREISLGEVANVGQLTGVDLVGDAWFTGFIEADGHTFMTTIADVEVDQETGQVRVLKLVNAHDCGRALNPVSVKGQLIGAAAMGLGYALYEEMPTHEGKPLTPTLTEYLMPMSLDNIDEWQPVIVEDPYATGPYGAKGVGEHATDSTPVAIMDAIFNATGLRITELPATPERVWQGLRELENA